MKHRARSFALFGLGALLASGCYDSRWGQQKTAQQHNAARATPASLRADDRESAPHLQRLRVRAYVSRAFTAQVVDTPRHLRELVEDTNRITERDIGVRLELVDTRTWERTNEEDIDKAFESPRAADPGEGVDWVTGFIGALPRATRSFHEVGKGSVVGKHLVVRAPSSAERHDDIAKAFDELSEDNRRDLEKHLRRHRATAVFLHELGHTLGSVHETSPESIMFPEYNGKMASFGESANGVMRAAVAAHDASDTELARQVRAALERAPDGAFVASERAHLVAQLGARMNRGAPGAATTAAAAPPALSPSAPAAAPEPALPDTPELSAADRERFVEAHRAMARGEMVLAWNTSKPLFDAYPRSLEVQDLRCQVASKSMRFELARRECDALMKLSTAPGK